MKDYEVKWEVDVLAETPEAACREAQSIQRDPASTATVFDVREHWRGGDEPEWKMIELPVPGALSAPDAAEQALALVRTIARMVKDGEYRDLGDGGEPEPYDQTDDDAMETLASLVNQARAITGLAPDGLLSDKQVAALATQED